MQSREERRKKREEKEKREIEKWQAQEASYYSNWSAEDAAELRKTLAPPEAVYPPPVAQEPPVPVMYAHNWRWATQNAFRLLCVPIAFIAYGVVNTIRMLFEVGYTLPATLLSNAFFSVCIMAALHYALAQKLPSSPPQYLLIVVYTLPVEILLSMLENFIYNFHYEVAINPLGHRFFGAATNIASMALFFGWLYLLVRRGMPGLKAAVKQPVAGGRRSHVAMRVIAIVLFAGALGLCVLYLYAARRMDNTLYTQDFYSTLSYIGDLQASTRFFALAQVLLCSALVPLALSRDK